MNRHNWNLAELLFLLVLSSGCVKLALTFSPSLIPNMSQAVFEECDPDLARQSLPADLKLMEGLLKSDPHNRQLLTSLCMGFSGYSMLFVEEEDPERASRLYLRAKDYGIKALGQKGDPFRASVPKTEEVQGALNALEAADIQALLWTALAWQAWINLNLDKPVALAQLGSIQDCVEKILDTAPHTFHGMPYILMGSILAAKPGILGGDPKRSKMMFENAVKVSEGRFYLAQFYFAKYYAVRTQNKQLFLNLLHEVIDSPAADLKETCLINAVMRQKAKRLLESSHDLFL